MRERITSILEREGIEVMFEATDRAAAALDGADGAWNVGIYVLAAAELTANGHLPRPLPDMRIVVVAPPLRRADIHRALEAGADGLVTHDRLETTLVPTVAAVSAGQIVLAGEFRNQVRKPLLSVREKQVLGMVVIGLSNGEVADTLFLSESTVKSHLSSAFAKLGVRSRNEAAALILDPDDGLGTGILAISGAEQPRGRSR